MEPFKQMKKIIVGETQQPDYVWHQPLIEQIEEASRQKEFSTTVAAIVKRAQDFSSNEEFWRKLLGLVEAANLAAAENNWIAAENAVTQASVLVNRAIRSESLKGARIRLALAPALWFVAVFVLEQLITYVRSSGLISFEISSEYFSYLWLGMLGGTTVVWWGIVKHSKDLTFDGAFVIWYLLKPPLGAIMGIIVVLVVKAGFVTLNTANQITNATPLYVLAFIGGFSERFFVNLIDKVTTALLGGEQRPTEQAPSAPLPRRAMSAVREQGGKMAS